MNSLAEIDEEADEVAAAPENAAKQTKSRSFPTVIVAGLGVLILVLTAATGLICYRSRAKTTNPTVVEQEMQAQNQVDDENSKALAEKEKKARIP